jgi:hypothetical protein
MIKQHNLRFTYTTPKKERQKGKKGKRKRKTRKKKKKLRGGKKKSLNLGGFSHLYL